MILARKIAAFSGVSVLLLAACGKPADSAAADPAAGSAAPSLAPADWSDASTLFIAPDGSPIGDAQFKSAPGKGVMMRFQLTGLAPGWHGIHLHAVGDCSDGAAGFMLSGGHINPEGRLHGLLNPEGPHLADIPNVFAGADGRATAEIFNPMAALTGDNAILDADGFAVVVHESADDHMTQPIGGAGARVACAAVTTTE